MANIVITGCSSGFGYYGALAFARQGDRVIATMRNPGKASSLTQTATKEGLPIEVRELDVTQTEAFAAFFENLDTEIGGIDVLVNNAGILRPGALEDLSESMVREVIETNLMGPLLLTRAVLPFMRARKKGYIIMISSLSGIAGLPGDVAYTASKFALEGATEALRHEVDRWGIKLALVEAGMYATGIIPAGDEKSLLPDYYRADSPYRALVETGLRALDARKHEAFDPEIVADLMTEIARSDGSRLRWPADPVATMVLEKMFAQNDTERDKFLREVSGSAWWSEGKDQA